MPLSVVGWNWTNSMSASGAPGTIRERHAVTGVDHGIRARQEDAPAASRGQDDGFRPDRMQPSMDQVPRHDSSADAVFHDQRRDIPLFIHGDSPFEQLFVHGVEDGMTGTIGGVTGARETRSAERTLGDPSLIVATEDDPQTF